MTFKIALMMFDYSRGQCPKYFGYVYTPVYTPLLLVRDCDQPITVTSSSQTHGTFGLAAAVSACEVQQFGTNLHRICEARSLNVGSMAGYVQCAYGWRRV